MPLRPVILRLQGKDEGATKRINDLVKRMNEARAPARRLDRALKDVFKVSGITAFATRMRSLGGIMFQFAKRAALFGGGLVAGLGAAVVKVIHFGDTLAKTAQRLGISTDQLQELRFGAALSGVDSDVLTRGLAELSKRLGKAKVAGGQLLPTFEKVAERIRNTKSATERSAIAFAYFGKAGSLLLPLLLEGKQGLRAMAEEARNLGVILDESTIKAAERADDALDRLKAVVQALGIRALAPLVPVVDRLTTKLTAWINENRELIRSKVAEYGERFAGFVEGLALRLPDVVNRMQEVAQSAMQIADAVKAVAGFVNWVRHPIAASKAQVPFNSMILPGGGLKQLGPPAFAQPHGQGMTLTLRLVDPSGLLVGQGKGALKPGSELTVGLDLGRAMTTP